MPICPPRRVPCCEHCTFSLFSKIFALQLFSLLIIYCCSLYAKFQLPNSSCHNMFLKLLLGQHSIRYKILDITICCMPTTRISFYLHESSRKRSLHYKTGFLSSFLPSFLPSFLCFLVPHLWHMEVPRFGVKSELHLLAYTTVTVRPDPSHICNVPHSSWPCWIVNLLSEAREQTCILRDTSWVHNPLGCNGNSLDTFFLNVLLGFLQ